MAKEIVSHQTNATAREVVEVIGPPSPPYTPERHAKLSGLSVVRLVALGNSPEGKTALFEFEGGFMRELVIDAQSIWHKSLSALPIKDRWQLRDHVTPPKTTVSDNHRKEQWGPMWFSQNLEDSRGRSKGRNSFDVPSETYYSGKVTGARAARDLVMFIKESDNSDAIEKFVVDSVIDAAVIAKRNYDVDRADEVFAAFEFITVIVQYAIGAAENANHHYLDGRVAWRQLEAEKNTAWFEAEIAKKKNALAERMKKLRDAKATKRTAVPQENTKPVVSQAELIPA